MSFYFDPIRLTPLDHMMPVSYIAFFYSFLVDDPRRAVPVLEDALHRLLQANPFLVGNLINSRSGEDNPTIRTVHPPTSESLREFPILQVRHHENEYIARRSHGSSCSGNQISKDALLSDTYLPVPLAAATAKQCPIIRWQANLMQDGLVVAVCFHHSVLDAAGFYIIQVALARCCREPDSTIQGLSLASDLLKGRQAMLETSPASGISGRSSARDLQALGVANFESAENLISRRLTLKPARIEYLKVACNALGQGRMENDPVFSQPQALLSSNDIISAVLWLVIMRARYRPCSGTLKGPDDSAQSSLILIIEIRRSLTPPLPMSYIGNGIVQTATSSPIRAALESVSQPTQTPTLTAHGLQVLTDLALKVHAIFSRVDDTFVKTLIREKQEAIDWSPRFRQADVTSTSLRRMGVYGLDFGPVLGKVVEFDSPDNRIDGTVCILPARVSSVPAPWEVRVTLQREVMVRLSQDPFMDWLVDNVSAKM
ncbi:putative acetyltransferase [Aspergillus uvarum CBS 121591]|uniref:Putative acetyltransferase n=1 Tax=Aspergillus uvarum CBS 121591 TaxID=1448315 RepID=A0A319C5R9_9EURO|nr:putative acetyltransferase [Aspergillus uvarum CBS 121591]PYH81196.1 putative acetyltransferase [Aspergillus uvarum CBS 121591]